MKSSTDRFSFILKTSTVIDGGVGVFALHDIAEGEDEHIDAKRLWSIINTMRLD